MKTSMKSTMDFLDYLNGMINPKSDVVIFSKNEIERLIEIVKTTRQSYN